jgi:hypothetical protein
MPYLCDFFACTTSCAFDLAGSAAVCNHPCLCGLFVWHAWVQQVLVVLEMCCNSAAVYGRAFIHHARTYTAACEPAFVPNQPERSIDTRDFVWEVGNS